MDQYTDKTREWLEDRFREADESGIYFAHQPIYGFDKGHCEGGIHDRYIITYEIMKALSGLKFSSLLDVGGAEGYKAFLAQELFGANVLSSDLSQVACQRASEIFHIKSMPADVHRLPFADEEFDVALCSESLEHVTDWQSGVKELLRVSRKAVVITIPHESVEAVNKVKEEGVPHGHIHNFELNSLDYLKDSGYRVVAKKIVRSGWRIPQILVDKKPRKENSAKKRSSGWFVDIYNFIFYWPRVILFRKPFGKMLTALSIEMDELLLKWLPAYNGLLFIVLKEAAGDLVAAPARVSARRMMNVTVPYYVLGGSSPAVK